MKISNNALNFLLAQYRAIFKRAYIKGIASAVILTAGLAAGQAQANAWKQHNAEFHKTEGITAGALGGNYFSGDGLEDEFKLTTVSGGELTIGGKTTDPGYLQSVKSGTVAGAWAIASTGNITAQDNKVTVTGSGSVTKDGLTGSGKDSRGVIFGAYAVADAGTASVLGNKIWVQDRNEADLAKAAASHGLTGAKAIGVGGAVANNNEVHVLGTDSTKRQVLGLGNEFDVLGGHATSKGNNATGAYTANQNIIDLQHVSASDAGASDSGLTIAGARITPSGTAAFTVGATGNQVSITDLAVTTASGDQSVNER